MAEPQRFDLVVIGSGPAGEKGAAQAAYFGKRVALVERLPAVGGACVHTGTLPSKTLRETALYVTGFLRQQTYGVTLEVDREASLRRLMGRLRSVVDLQVAQVRSNLDRHGVTLFQGWAELVSPHEVSVRDGAGTETARLEAPVLLVATGSSPYRPAGVPFSDPDVHDSDTILDLDRIPEALAVVGGGVIGCEYACMFAALGTRVTVIEGRAALLGFLDPELSDALRAALERGGSTVLLGAAVESIERTLRAEAAPPPEPSHGTSRREGARPLALRLRDGRTLLVDKVLYSAGRRGNTQGLGLERAGVALDASGRVVVDERFQTSVPHVYAAGDVIGSPALASVSMEQGRVAMCHAFGLSYKTRVSALTPYGVFTIPEISMVGATEPELARRGVPYEVGRARYGGNARGQIMGEQDGLLKLVFEVPSKRLLGVHMVGDRATELVHVGQMVLHHGGTIDTFIESVFNYPTLAEIYKYAAYDGLQRLARRG